MIKKQTEELLHKQFAEDLQHSLQDIWLNLLTVQSLRIDRNFSSTHCQVDEASI